VDVSSSPNRRRFARESVGAFDAASEANWVRARSEGDCLIQRAPGAEHQAIALRRIRSVPPTDAGDFMRWTDFPQCLDEHGKPAWLAIDSTLSLPSDARVSVPIRMRITSDEGHPRYEARNVLFYRVVGTGRGVWVASLHPTTGQPLIEMESLL
jgi:hypothetical protein